MHLTQAYKIITDMLWPNRNLKDKNKTKQNWKQVMRIGTWYIIKAQLDSKDFSY